MDQETRTTDGDLDDLTPQLVRKLRQGDAHAAAELNRLYRDAMYRFCWGYLGSNDEAEDAVQDVCFKVLTAKDVPERFRPWLYRVARNHCLNLLRSRNRRQDAHRLPSASQLPQALTGQLTRLVRDEHRSHVVAMLDQLPEAQQEVLRLRYAESLSRTEIAEILDLSESVVKSRLFEGLTKLREQAALLDSPQRQTPHSVETKLREES